MVFSIFYFCAVYAHHFPPIYEVYISFFYLSFLTMRYLNDEDGVSADTVAADVAITLSTSRMYPMWGLGYKRIFARHGVRDAFVLSKI